MSGHGHRNAALLVDATVWRDRVIGDVRGEGRAAARAQEVSVDLVIAVAELIAAYMAAGESLVSRTDLKLSGYRSGYWISARQEQRLVRYLEARGHIERTDDRDLIRPVGARADEGALGEPRSTDRPHSAVDKRKNRKYAAAIPALPG